MTEVIIAHEKDGTFLYATPIACLSRRVADGYWYDGEDELVAREIIRRFNQGDEDEAQSLAQRFLRKRSSAEYEGIEIAPVID